MPEKANSLILVRPAKSSPALRSGCMTSASSLSVEQYCLRTMDPARVFSPLRLNRSLIVTGMPASGGKALPLRLAESIASASLSRPSLMRINTDSVFLARCKVCSAIATAETLPAAVSQQGRVKCGFRSCGYLNKLRMKPPVLLAAHSRRLRLRIESMAGRPHASRR